KVYDNGRQKWSYAGFDYRCDKWENAYRTLYTRPNYDGPQGLLEFARPDNIIVTNLASADLNDECLIYHHHQRGGDELPHRGLKEFGSEQMPFKRFGANQAFYYLMVIAFFLFETFKEDNLQDILPISSYATTVRRRLIDMAAKVVRTGGAIILKVPKAIMECLKLGLICEFLLQALQVSSVLPSSRNLFTPVIRCSASLVRTRERRSWPRRVPKCIAVRSKTGHLAERGSYG